MKQITTVLLAGSFALATTVAFAQVGVGTSSGTSGGAAIRNGSNGSYGSTRLNSSTNANVGGTKAGVSADASGNAALKKKKSTTTGSGSLGTGVNGTVK